MMESAAVSYPKDEDAVRFARATPPNLLQEDSYLPSGLSCVQLAWGQAYIARPCLEEGLPGTVA